MFDAVDSIIDVIFVAFTTVKLPPIHKLAPIPTPPVIVNAPVFEEVDSTIPSIITLRFTYKSSSIDSLPQIRTLPCVVNTILFR